MHEQNESTPDKYFPCVETFPDFSGKPREFIIELQTQSRGYFLRAHEKQPTNEQGGYSFAAYSPVDPFYALGVLRDKIRRGLATRYIVLEQGKHSLSHDKLIGHVDFGGIVVDGEFLSFEEFYSILQAYEGFQFSLKIADPYDDL